MKHNFMLFYKLFRIITDIDTTLTMSMNDKKKHQQLNLGTNQKTTFNLVTINLACVT